MFITYLSQKISYLRHDLRYHSITTSSQASSLWLQRLAQGKHLKGDFPLEPFRERLAELKLHNLKLCKLSLRTRECLLTPPQQLK